MNELDMFTALRPEQGPVDVSSQRERLTAAIGGTPVRRVSRKTRFTLAGGLAAAAAAAAIVVPSLLPGGAKAWAVDHNQNGTVTLTIQQAFGNLAGLQQTLRADGVPAIVVSIPWKVTQVDGSTRAVQACGYVSLPLEPEAVQRAVITDPTPGNKGNDWTINPAAMPRGSVVFIEASPTAPSATAIGAGIKNPVVLRSSQLPTCVPGHGTSAPTVIVSRALHAGFAVGPRPQPARSRTRSMRATRLRWSTPSGVTSSVVTPDSCSAASRSRM
jgi:hypothetical protein